MKNSLIEKVLNIVKNHNNFTGIYNLNLDICYYSNEDFLESVGNNCFSELRKKGEEDFVLIKKNGSKVEVSYSSSDCEEVVKIDLLSDYQNILFFSEEKRKYRQFSKEERSKITDQALKEIKEHFSSPRDMTKLTKGFYH